MRRGVRVPKTEPGGRVGALIRAIRIERKETLTGFAERVGVTHVVVIRWETGVFAPRVPHLAKIGTLAGPLLRQMVVDELRQIVPDRASRMLLAEVAR